MGVPVSWRKIPITLKMPGKGEWKAQAYEWPDYRSHLSKRWFGMKHYPHGV